VIGIILGCIGFVALESIGGGGIIHKGSQKSKDIDVRVKEKLTNSQGSSREELQEWWDTYHPQK